MGIIRTVSIAKLSASCIIQKEKLLLSTEGVEHVITITRMEKMVDIGSEAW